MTADSAKNRDSSQAQRIIEAVRALGVDEDEVAFKAKLAVIARQKSKSDQGKTGSDK